MHIQNFHRDAAAAKSKGEGKRKSHNERRLIAMERQRDRLQEKQHSSIVDEEDESSSPGAQDPADNPWIHLASVLNSLRVVTPVVLRMVLHPRRNDGGLFIQGESIAPAEKKPKCWLLGDHVFDICKVKSCKLLYRRLVEIFQLFHVAEKDVTNASNVWRTVLLETMKEIAAQTGTTASGVSPNSRIKVKPHSRPNCKFGRFHSLDDFSEDKRAAVEELTHALDEKFSLREDRNVEQHRLYQRAVTGLHAHVSKLIQHVFPRATLSIYGSCLSDLSLGKSSDVDISIYIEQAQQSKNAFENGSMPASKYERETKNTVYKVCRKLEGRRDEFRDIYPVCRARVPVVNGIYIKADNPYTADGSMAFDICFLNDIAVANSSLLRQYSLVDPRSKELMIAVKRWSKANNISSAKDSFFSSYTWTILCIFYLQNIGFVPNLQSAELMAKTKLAFDKTNRWHCINNLDTRYVEWRHASAFWSQPEELATVSVSALLYGFFRFYASQFPFNLYLISIKRAEEGFLPKTVFRRCSRGLVIEDPFETYDSHCPHNLGGHASDSGMLKIIECFRKAEEHLQKAFSHDRTGIASLWPAVRKTGSAQPKTANQKQRPRNGRDAGTRRNLRNRKSQPEKETAATNSVNEAQQNAAARTDTGADQNTASTKAAANGDANPPCQQQSTSVNNGSSGQEYRNRTTGGENEPQKKTGKRGGRNRNRGKKHKKDNGTTPSTQTDGPQVQSGTKKGATSKRNGTRNRNQSGKRGGAGPKKTHTDAQPSHD